MTEGNAANGGEADDARAHSEQADDGFGSGDRADGERADDERTGSEEAERGLRRHGAFEREGGTFVTSTTAADARVRAEQTGSVAVFRVTVRVPTIDAVVAGETVAPVVQEGWFETFERRLEDVGGATRADPRTPTAELDDAVGEVVVETALESDRPASAADDVKAIVDYVEGTFVEGLIPGYTYREPAAGLLERARSSGQQ